MLNPIYAQRFKGAAITGLSTNQIDGDTQAGYNKVGAYAGVFVETDFTKVIGTKIELYYIGKGARKEGSDYFKTSLHYVEMPLLLTIKPVTKVQLDIGIYGSYLIDSKFEIYSGPISEDLYEMNNFDFGGMITGTYFFKPRAGFNVRFSYSFIPVKENPNWFNENLCFGLIFRFNK